MLAFSGLFTATACLAGSLSAEAIDLRPALLDTIQIVERRPFPEETLGWHRGFIQVVELGPAIPVLTDLGEVLERVAGVQVRRTGGLGAVTLASLRGMSSAQVQVLLDDTPVSTAPDAAANLALIPTAQFSRLEVARGPLDLDYSCAASGVLRLVTDERADIRPKIRVGVGSFRSRAASAFWGLRRGGTSLLLAGGRTESRGDFPYRDRRGTPWEEGDDRTVRRENNAFHQGDALLQVRSRIGVVRIEGTGHGLWKDAGVPGTENIQTRNVHDRFRRWLQSLSLRMEGASARLRLSARMQEDQDRFENPEGEVGLGIADRKDRARTFGAEVSAGLDRWLGRIDLGGQGALTRELWRTEDRVRPWTDASHERTILGGSIEARSRLARERLTVLAGVRGVAGQADIGAGEDPPLLPHAGFVWEPSRQVVIRGGCGASARLPSLVELFGQGGVQVGNPDLVAERVTAWDLGGTLRWGSRDPLRGQLEAAVFGNRTREAILWLQNSQRTHRAQNIDRAEVWGVETLLRLIPRGLPVSAVAAVTYQDARDRGPLPAYRDKKLPYLPDLHCSAELRADLGTLHAAYFASYESGIYRDRYNTPEKRRGHRALHDVELHRGWLGGVAETRLVVRNVADLRTQDIDGFPLPGRSVQLELTVSTALLGSEKAPPREAGASNEGKSDD